MRTRYSIGFCLLAALILTGMGFVLFTPLLPNVWHLATGRGFEIPDESNLMTFNVTEMNHGSGEWWLHAEDSNYFYAYSQCEGVRYHAFPKNKMRMSKGFLPHDSTTWDQAFVVSPKVIKLK